MCTYSIWVVGGPNTSALEQESHAGDVLALAVAEGVHELTQLGRALDLEEDLIVVVGDLDVQVLRRTSILRLLSWRAVVGHVCLCGGCGVLLWWWRYGGWCVCGGTRLILASVGVRRSWKRSRRSLSGGELPFVWHGANGKTET